ncbi:efflux RND transporter periplasmic adaptor subunit [Sporomusa acidovorans]|uniref:Multidrug resistance protein MdtA n=1 Tax=Sporomusa acidovorans (strain ATCC 49682 / DSM 3132 / Mol) TaxID=1123286 RepID=A0ABZ3J5R6_SPOA4|nr:efflux RND transporter periplasmic adaptor subunit [Sporomusa acidovorans]OZC18279.1 multidrug resistance protein MdtA precursor [Sporomusa acidovorans DSM 3132]SDF26465.1 RND family efflux transporter, MFP subunit [Sporomusa acidovorans]
MQQWNWLTKVSKKQLYYSLTAIVTALCIIGGMVWNAHRQTKVVAEDITAVQTTVIGAAAAAQEYTYSGEVRGRYESQLAFQVSGKIIKRNVELGSVINASDVLMQIDPKDIQQTVNSTSAQVSSAESQLRLAENNLNRFRQLYEDGAVGRMTYEQNVSAYEVAAAAVQQASAQHSQGANQLDYSLLRTDKPGVVSAIKAEVGQVVSAGQPVLTIVQDGEREVEISVPENRIEELRKAQQLKVTFWALSNVILDGKVREIAPMADPVTRTYKVRISLLNPPPEMKLGMTAAVTLLDSETQPTATIPLAAIYQNGDTPCVWVVTDNTVALRPIKTGKFGNGTIQVVAGLQQGDRIVTAGVHKLTAGQNVKLGGDSL